MRKVIQYQVPQYVPVPDDFQTETMRQWNGVNTYDALSIPSNQLTDMSNMTSESFPALEVRPGYSVLGSTGASKVLGMGVWKDQQIHVTLSDGTWKKWNGSSWDTVMSGLSTTSPSSWTNFQGNLTDINLFMAQGSGGLRKWDGTSAAAFGDAPADINFISVYQNRLVGASGKEIHMSSLDQPDQWNQFDISVYGDEASFAQDIENSRGENISFVSGSLTQLTIGCPNSVHELYGSVPSDFNTHLITEDSGFPNNNSGTTQAGIMRFAHGTGIYQYAGGTIPNKSFSDIMKRYFAAGVDSNTTSGSDGVKLYFRTSTSQILMYDPRPGITAWHVWNDIDPTCFAIMQNVLYIGTSDGRVLKFDDGATDDNGTAISYKAVTKPFSATSISQKSRAIKAFITVDMGAGSTVNVYYSPSVSGDSDWTLAKSFTATTGITSQRIVAPMPDMSFVSFYRIKIEGTGWIRLHELSTQRRVNPLY